MRGWNSIFVLAAVAVFATAPIARAANCPQAEISSAASDLQDARNALMSLPVGKEGDTAISRQMQTGIAEMKTHLASFILAYMRCQSDNADTDGVEVDLSRLGWARSLEPGRAYRKDELPPLSDAPGWALTFNTRSLGQGLLGVSATFGIPCGSDTMLLIFQHGDNGWREIMRVASPPYRDIGQAYQAFDYALSQPDDAGDWFLVEKHLPAACESFNASIYYSVMRPGPSALKPRLLFSGHDGIYWGDEDMGRLAAGTDSFELRFHDYDASGDALQEYVRRFSVMGQAVTPMKNPPPQ